MRYALSFLWDFLNAYAFFPEFSVQLATSTGPWKEYTSDTGRKYYYNTVTHVTTWETPAELKGEGKDAAPPVDSPKRYVHGVEVRVLMFTITIGSLINMPHILPLQYILIRKMLSKHSRICLLLWYVANNSITPILL